MALYVWRSQRTLSLRSVFPGVGFVRLASIEILYTREPHAARQRILYTFEDVFYFH